MEINNLFVYGSLKEIGLFEEFFKITPDRIVDSEVLGEIYMADWYPLYVKNENGIVQGKNLQFKRITQTLLDKLDEYEQTEEGIFVRKPIKLIESDISWIYEANPNHEFVNKFINRENKIKLGNFEITSEVLENARRYLE